MDRCGSIRHYQIGWLVQRKTCHTPSPVNKVDLETIWSSAISFIPLQNNLSLTAFLSIQSQPGPVRYIKLDPSSPTADKTQYVNPTALLPRLFPCWYRLQTQQAARLLFTGGPRRSCQALYGAG